MTTPTQWTVDALAKLGQEGLRAHLVQRAVAAHEKYGPLTVQRLPEFLNDPDCLRYPTRLVYEFGDMALHQFAQPGPDPLQTEPEGRILYLRPRLQHRPDLVPLAVAYLVPLINYGEIVNDAHCLLYGATLMGMLEDEFYTAVCAMADDAGAAPEFPQLPNP